VIFSSPGGSPDSVPVSCEMSLAVRSGIASSGPAVDQDSSSRRILNRRWCQRPILQPSSAVNLPAVPSTNLRFSSDIASSAVPAFNLQLSSSIVFSAGFNLSSTRAADQPQSSLQTQPLNLLGRCISGLAFQSVCDLRRLLAFQPCLRTQPPALTGCCHLRLRLPVTLRLASSNYLPALPSNSTSDSHRLSHPLTPPSN